MMPFQRDKGPPKDVEPSALLARLLNSVPPNEVYPWFRKDDDGQPLGHYAMVVLTQADIDSCKADAELYASHMLNGKREDKANQEAWQDIYSSALAVELIWRACRDKEDKSVKLFRTPQEIRDNLTGDEILHLWETYDALQVKFGPLTATLSDDELKLWIETLVEGVNDPFGHLSRGTLVQLIVSLVSLVRSLRNTES